MTNIVKALGFFDHCTLVFVQLVSLSHWNMHWAHHCASVQTQINTHCAAVYLDPNWTRAKSSSSSESSSLLSWDISERAKNRNDKGLTWQGKDRRSKGKIGRKEDVTHEWVDRREVKMWRQMWNGKITRKDDKKKAAGGMHACLKTISSAV